MVARNLLALIAGLALLGAGSCCDPARAATGTAHVTILLSSQGEPYSMVEQTLRQRLEASDTPVSIQSAVVDQADTRATLAGNTDLIVSVGTDATREALQLPGDVPVFGLLLPQLAFDALAGEAGQHAFSAVFIDQPLERQFHLARMIIPELRTVGVLLGPTSSDRLPEIRAAARQAGVEIDAQVLQSANDDLAARLNPLLSHSQLLLAMPDPVAYNRFTVQNILLSTFHEHVPVQGYSPSFVAAGAVAGLYSTPQQIAQQGADAVASALESRGPIRLPDPAYPARFQVEVNASVASALGLGPLDETLLQTRLEQSGHDR
ncbi:MAG: ABC transporter substrate binding protein [Gammaproteobacteria bacterium]